MFSRYTRVVESPTPDSHPKKDKCNCHDLKWWYFLVYFLISCLNISSVLRLYNTQSFSAPLTLGQHKAISSHSKLYYIEMTSLCQIITTPFSQILFQCERDRAGVCFWATPIVAFWEILREHDVYRTCTQVDGGEEITSYYLTAQQLSGRVL